MWKEQTLTTKCGFTPATILLTFCDWASNGNGRWYQLSEWKMCCCTSEVTWTGDRIGKPSPCHNQVSDWIIFWTTATFSAPFVKATVQFSHYKLRSVLLSVSFSLEIRHDWRRKQRWCEYYNATRVLAFPRKQCSLTSLPVMLPTLVLFSYGVTLIPGW